MDSENTVDPVPEVQLAKDLLRQQRRKAYERAKAWRKAKREEAKAAAELDAGREVADRDRKLWATLKRATDLEMEKGPRGVGGP